MRVLIVYNQPVLAETHAEADSEHQIVGTVAAVSEILVQAGIEVSRLALGRNLQSLSAEMSRQRPHVVFNLFEGHADQPTTETTVAEILEQQGIPFTGCPARTLRVARNKPLTKRILLSAGLPTPRYQVVEKLPVPACKLRWPVIAKPAMEDASIGIEQSSVTTCHDQLTRRVAYLLETYGPPILVEEFVAGREFSIALVEGPHLLALPISEIQFLDSIRKPDVENHAWPIVTYDAKWKPGSRDYQATPPNYLAIVEPQLAVRLAELAVRAYRMLDCRDYARVDFRVTPTEQPYILEVNPNPDFGQEACLAGSLSAAGRTHAEFTMELVYNALRRQPQPKVQTHVVHAFHDERTRVFDPSCEMRNLHA